ncbi:MAG: tetratricopeptide repeat protein [Thermoguttaceae bacterium]
MPPQSRNRWTPWIVCGLLALAIALVFGQTVRYDFINLDDDVCITGNPQITGGLSWQAVGWAFTHRYFGNWDPMTWISHMADWQLYGPNAGGHHLTNVLLHAATAVLLFVLLRQMTGAVWSSALAAALFALHPLRVESVAWVTERKDVLSGLFCMLTLLAYWDYVRRPFSMVRYLTVLVLFALGLMAKPMLVTLPCVLLLLDVWPLGRMKPQWRVVLRLTVEKVPLLALVAGCCAITVWAEGVRLHEYLPVRWQLGNALLSYVAYLRQCFYPIDLSPLGLRRGLEISNWAIAGAGLVLASVTAVAAALAKRRPYLLVGWLWYLGMLFPVIGLVPFGTQAPADRFTYLPQIGLWIALVWAIADLCRAWPRLRVAVAPGAMCLVAMLMVLSWRQTAYWRDSVTLWSRTVACTPANHRAHNILGNALVERAVAEQAVDLHEMDRAIAEYREAIRIKPGYAEAYYGLGAALATAGRPGEAAAEFRRAIALQSNYAIAENDLGNLLAQAGQLDEAMTHCRKAVEIEPAFAKAHFNLGEILQLQNRLHEAVTAYEVAARLRPNSLEYRCRLGEALSGLGRQAAAEAEYREALELATRQGEHALADLLRQRIAKCQSAVTRPKQ